MGKGTKFPSNKVLHGIRNRLSKGPASKLLPADASPIYRTKYAICRAIIIYKNERKLTQRQLADKIGENESILSKVTHYNFKEFTIDRLLKFLAKLYKNAEIKI
ncbi:MAG: hypothetical protein A3F16_01995, partial [Deltaproteobacteria bacterium RIFCSPHIGHO2_12_FULL_43_9]